MKICVFQKLNGVVSMTFKFICQLSQHAKIEFIIAPPYWSRGSEKQYYVSKRCATRDNCTRIINKAMPSCNYIWYLDWKCAECCAGDRCNYYVTVISYIFTACMRIHILYRSISLKITVTTFSFLEVPSDSVL